MKLTLFGLERWLNQEKNTSLFENIKLPSSDLLEKEVLVNTIILECGEFETLYADAEFMQFATENFFSKNYRTFDKWLNALEIEYAPLENYDRLEDETNAAAIDTYSRTEGLRKTISVEGIRTEEYDDPDITEVVTPGIVTTSQSATTEYSIHTPGEITTSHGSTSETVTHTPGIITTSQTISTEDTTHTPGLVTTTSEMTLEVTTHMPGTVTTSHTASTEDITHTPSSETTTYTNSTETYSHTPGSITTTHTASTESNTHKEGDLTIKKQDGAITDVLGTAKSTSTTTSNPGETYNINMETPTFTTEELPGFSSSGALETTSKTTYDFVDAPGATLLQQPLNAIVVQPSDMPGWGGGTFNHDGEYKWTSQQVQSATADATSTTENTSEPVTNTKRFGEGTETQTHGDTTDTKTTTPGNTVVTETVTNDSKTIKPSDVTVSRTVYSDTRTTTPGTDTVTETETVDNKKIEPGKVTVSEGQTRDTKTTMPGTTTVTEEVTTDSKELSQKPTSVIEQPTTDDKTITPGTTTVEEKPTTRSITHTSGTKTTQGDSSKPTTSETGHAPGQSDIGTENIGERRRNAHIHGNIGVTTSQQMLQSELDIARFNLYNEIARMYMIELTIPVYL